MQQRPHDRRTQDPGGGDLKDRLEAALERATAALEGEKEALTHAKEALEGEKAALEAAKDAKEALIAAQGALIAALARWRATESWAAAVLAVLSGQAPLAAVLMRSAAALARLATLEEAPVPERDQEAIERACGALWRLGWHLGQP